MSLAHTGFERITKRTRKRQFLDEMNLVIAWTELLALIAPHAPAGKTRRQPLATEVMLRIHLPQQFFGHSAPAMEEALYDIPLYCEFVYLDVCITRLPGASTSWAADSGSLQRQVNRPRPDAQDQHCGGYHSDLGAQLDQECPRRGRPQNAPD